MRRPHVSSQPGNDDDGEPDAIVVDAHHATLLAERTQGRARIYTLTLTCTDAGGVRTIRNDQRRRAAQQQRGGEVGPLRAGCFCPGLRDSFSAMVKRSAGVAVASTWLTLSIGLTPISAQPPAPVAVAAIRAGRLLDPEAGRILTNQIIVVEGNRIRDVGPNVAVPAGAQVIDLSALTVMPGMVDAHNPLALTYKPEPESNVYYSTYVQESTALRAIEAASNGMQMLAAGFTVVRDLGNNGNYADSALRQAIEQGWLPGPTIINSGIIIGGMGGQFFPPPEMVKDHSIVYPEYLDAD